MEDNGGKSDFKVAEISLSTKSCKRTKGHGNNTQTGADK